jgi:hypothetical protein
MIPSEIKINLVDSYFMLLKNLSPDHKLELISLLSKSITTSDIKNDQSWKSLYGAMELDQPVEDFIDELKKERHFNRKPIEL